MTRFARASGSKGSNEKAPEEASNWLDIKKSMLQTKGDKKSCKTFQAEDDANGLSVPTTTEIETVWADLVAESGITKSGEVDSKKKKRKAASVAPDDVVNASKKKKRRADFLTDSSMINNEAKDIEPVPLTQKKKIKNLEGNDNVKVKNKIKKIKVLNVEAPNLDREIKKKKIVAEDEPIAELSKKAKRKLKSKECENSELGAATVSSESISKKRKNENNIGAASNVKPIQTPREKKRRKAALQETQTVINGRSVKLTPFDGFVVLSEDAERLKVLRKSLIEKGIEKVEREKVMKLERRRAEKALQRLKRQVCFHCRASGHVLSECPKIEKDQSATGICYKCGSTEHTHYECKVTRRDDFKYAECFICKEQGHIAKQCPDNPRGLYPRGGGCALCGDVTHLRKDCPKYATEQQEEKFTVAIRDNHVLEALEEDEVVSKPRVSNSGTKKHIKFN